MHAQCKQARFADQCNQRRVNQIRRRMRPANLIGVESGTETVPASMESPNMTRCNIRPASQVAECRAATRKCFVYLARSLEKVSGLKSWLGMPLRGVMKIKSGQRQAGISALVVFRQRERSSHKKKLACTTARCKCQRSLDLRIFGKLEMPQ